MGLLGAPVSSGKWYFEVVPGNGELMQVGLCGTVDLFAVSSNYGVGDVANTWGYCCYRNERFAGAEGQGGLFGASKRWGKRSWRGNDVLGVFVDLDAKTIGYALNGDNFGTCFEKVAVDASVPSLGFFPAVSYSSSGMSAQFVLGAPLAPFRYAPPASEGWKPWAAAIPGLQIGPDAPVDAAASTSGTAKPASSKGKPSSSPLPDFIPAAGSSTPGAAPCLRLASGGNVVIQSNAGFDLRTEFTLEFWVRPDKLGPAAQTLVCKGGDAASGGYWLTITDAGHLQFATYGACPTVTTAAPCIQAGLWQHVAVVCKQAASEAAAVTAPASATSSGYSPLSGPQPSPSFASTPKLALEVFVNFKSVETLSLELSSLKLTTSPVAVGATPSKGSPFTGFLGLFRVWSCARGLSDLEASASRGTNVANSSGIVACYRLDAGCGMFALDTGATSSYHGSFSSGGGATWAEAWTLADAQLERNALVQDKIAILSASATPSSGSAAGGAGGESSSSSAAPSVGQVSSALARLRLSGFDLSNGKDSDTPPITPSGDGAFGALAASSPLVVAVNVLAQLERLLDQHCQTQSDITALGLSAIKPEQPPALFDTHHRTYLLFLSLSKQLFDVLSNATAAGDAGRDRAVLASSGLLSALRLLRANLSHLLALKDATQLAFAGLAKPNVNVDKLSRLLCGILDFPFTSPLPAAESVLAPLVKSLSDEAASTFGLAFPVFVVAPVERQQLLFALLTSLQGNVANVPVTCPEDVAALSPAAKAMLLDTLCARVCQSDLLQDLLPASNPHAWQAPNKDGPGSAPFGASFRGEPKFRDASGPRGGRATIKKKKSRGGRGGSRLGRDSDVSSGPGTELDVEFSSASDGVDISDNSVFFHGDDGSQYNYALVTHSFGSGRHSWTVEIIDEVRGNEAVAFGVSRSPVSNPSYRTSPQMWVYATRGDLYMQGSPMRGVVPRLAAGDVIQCTLDMDVGSLSFVVNGSATPAQILGIPVDAPVHPVIAFVNSSEPSRGASITELRTNIGGGDKSEGASAATTPAPTEPSTPRTRNQLQWPVDEVKRRLLGTPLPGESPLFKKAVLEEVRAKAPEKWAEEKMAGTHKWKLAAAAAKFQPQDIFDMYEALYGRLSAHEAAESSVAALKAVVPEPLNDAKLAEFLQLLQAFIGARLSAVSAVGGATRLLAVVQAFVVGIPPNTALLQKALPLRLYSNDTDADIRVSAASADSDSEDVPLVPVASFDRASAGPGAMIEGDGDNQFRHSGTAWATVRGVTAMPPGTGVYRHKVRLLQSSSGFGGLSAFGICSAAASPVKLVGSDPDSASFVSIGDIYSRGSRQSSCGFKASQGDYVEVAYDTHAAAMRVSVYSADLPYIPRNSVTYDRNFQRGTTYYFAVTLKGENDVVEYDSLQHSLTPGFDSSIPLAAAYLSGGGGGGAVSQAQSDETLSGVPGGWSGFAPTSPPNAEVVAHVVRLSDWFAGAVSSQGAQAAGVVTTIVVPVISALSLWVPLSSDASESLSAPLLTLANALSVLRRAADLPPTTVDEIVCAEAVAYHLLGKVATMLVLGRKSDLELPAAATSTAPTPVGGDGGEVVESKAAEGASEAKESKDDGPDSPSVAASGAPAAVPTANPSVLAEVAGSQLFREGLVSDSLDDSSLGSHADPFAEALVTMDADEFKFLQDLVYARGQAETLHAWVSRFIAQGGAAVRKSRGALDTGCRAVVAAMLYHSGLLPTAMRTAAALCTPTCSAVLASRADAGPANALRTLWSTSIAMKTWGGSDAVKKAAGGTYQFVNEQLLRRSAYLLRLQPSREDQSESASVIATDEHDGLVLTVSDGVPSVMWKPLVETQPFNSVATLEASVKVRLITCTVELDD